MPKVLDNPKERILKEARILLNENGYNSLSMRELAKNSNIALGTLYNYFKNKYDLVSNLFDSDWHVILLKLKKVNGLNISFDEKIRKIKEGIEEFLDCHRGLFLEISESDTYEKRNHIEDVMYPLYEITEDIINYHINKGELKEKIDSRKLAIFITANIILIIKEKSLTFEDLMSIIK